MKAFVASSVLFLLVSGCSHLQPVQRGIATIEFERQEDNGSVNIVPCTLVLSDDQKIVLSGGERAVISIAAGSFYVAAFSIDPYSPHSDERAWRSRRRRFRVAERETLRITVEPASSGSTYTGGWSIQAANHALHRTAICAWGLPWGFSFIRQCVAVGELGR